jgi:hypothetical protein
MVKPNLAAMIIHPAANERFTFKHEQTGLLVAYFAVFQIFKRCSKLLTNKLRFKGSVIFVPDRRF